MRMHSFYFLFVIFLLTSCGNDSSKDTSKTGENQYTAGAGRKKLDGSWVIRRAEGSMAEMNVGTVYHFDGDKLTFSQSGFSNPGKTVITDTSFTFQADGNELKLDYNYYFEGDTLVVKMQNSNQVFYLAKE